MRLNMSETNRAGTGQTGTEPGFQNDVQRLGQYVGQLNNDLAGIAKGAGEVVHSGVAAAREEGRSTIEAAKRRSGQATASLRDLTVNHPGTTLGIAVGLGVLIGLVGPAIFRAGRRAS
jgi:ElaB/YqjD/DUF883 family membrane-anchored ribosome-binding protein